MRNQSSDTLKHDVKILRTPQFPQASLKIFILKINAMERQLSPVLEKELISFFSEHPPKRLDRNLRRVLLDFLRRELKSGSPFYLQDLLWDTYYLFELLDLAAWETRDWPDKKEFQPVDLYNDFNAEVQEHVQKVKEARTTEKETEAWDAISGFFKNYRKDEAIESIWKISMAAITNPQHESDARERDDIIYFYEKLKEVIEAAYLLNKNQLNQL
jgi:hypothetical protein